MEFCLPMVLKKNTRHILFSLILSGLFGQIEEEKEPRTFLFGLIKFDTESAYEDGIGSINGSMQENLHLP